jgi:archaetidylinositol phosphate synthase
MVLDAQRKNIDPVLTSIAQRFIHVDPNVLTTISLGMAFLAGVFFYFSSPAFELFNYYLFIGVLFVFMNGFFDAIDGKVAMLSNKTSKKGDFIDHAVDRYADVFIVGGIALSTWCDTRIGFLAIIGVLLTSYMGTQSQAIGDKRDYSGLLGRADRLILLMIIPLIQHIVLRFGYPSLWGLSLVEWMMIYFAVIGNVTAVQRFHSTLSWLRKKNSKQ